MSMLPPNEQYAAAAAANAPPAITAATHPAPLPPAAAPLEPAAAAAGQAAAPPVVVPPAVIGTGDAAQPVRVSDKLLVVSFVQLALKNRHDAAVAAAGGGAEATAAALAPASTAPLASLNWEEIANQVSAKTSSKVSPHSSLTVVFGRDGCAAAFRALLESMRALPACPAFNDPTDPKQVNLLLSFTVDQLTQARIAELQRGLAECELIKKQCEQAIEVGERLKAERMAAKAQAAAASSPVASPTPVASPSAALPAASAGGVSVKLEALGAGVSRPANLLSPIPEASGSSSVASSTIAAPAAARPSPVLIPSPSAGVAGPMPWPSALHTPLKAPPTIAAALARQNTTPIGGGSSTPGHHPSLSRLASAPYETPISAAAVGSALAPGASPSTPSAAPPSLPYARFVELAGIILATLTAHPDAEAFLEPVDPQVAPAYYDIIKQPMSFRDVREQVEAGEITTPLQLYAAIDKIYANCYAFNGPPTGPGASSYSKSAARLQLITNDWFKKNLPGYGGPWEAKGVARKGPKSGVPAYAVIVPTTPLVVQGGAAAAAAQQQTNATPQQTPSTGAGGGGQLGAIPLHLPGTPAPTSSPLSPTPSTPTRKGAPVGRTLTGSGGSEAASSVAAAASDDALPPESHRTAGSRRSSVATSAGRKGGRADAEGDESMGAATEDGAAPATSTTPAADSEANAETASVGGGGWDDAAPHSIQDAITPARGGAAGRKRGASALLTPSTPAAAGPGTAAAPTSTPATLRKGGPGRRAGAPASATTAPTPPPSSPAIATAAEEGAEEAPSTVARRGRGRPKQR